MENHSCPSCGCHPTASQTRLGDAGAASGLKMEEKPEGELEGEMEVERRVAPHAVQELEVRGDSRRRLRGHAPITALSR